MKDIIIVDDEKDIRSLLSTILEEEGYETRTAANSQELFEHLKGRLPNIILLDIWLKKSQLDGIETLHKLVQHFPDIDIIMISGHGNSQTATHAMQIGAYGFMEKPIKSDYLLLMLERLINLKKIKIATRYYDNKSLYIEKPACLLGQSFAIANVQAQLAKQLDKDNRVLITGEIGTGKYDIAYYLHNHSIRKDSLFVSVPMNFKMDTSFLEKELFGYSNQNNPEYVGKKGALEKAHMGTIYLEKIDLYPHSIQKKLIKFLVDKKFTRFMSVDKVVYSDVRVLASLSTNLEIALENDLLLKDLYVRLGGNLINMPSLRQRQEDIPILVKSYAQEFSLKYQGYQPKISQDLLDFLQGYNWQQNLAELKNLIKLLIKNAYERHDYLPISYIHLPEIFKGLQSEAHIIVKTLNKPLRDARELFERDYLVEQLSRFKGNISKTAQFVGMERSALHRKLRSLNIDNYRENSIELID
jgi:two-component system nitrogen regulation response regulator NtrX